MQRHQKGSEFVDPFSFEGVGDEDRHRAKLATEHGAVIRPMAACPHRYVRGRVWEDVLAAHTCPTGVGDRASCPIPSWWLRGPTQAARRTQFHSYASQRDATDSPRGPGVAGVAASC